MVSRKLIHLIEKSDDELARRWIAKVTSHPDTFSYHKVPAHQLHERIIDAYKALTHYIEDKLTLEHIQKAYLELGAERYREGYRLHEVVRAIMLAHRNLHLFVREKGIFDDASDLHQLVELDDRVDKFFNQVIFFTVKGYEMAFMADHKKG